MEVKNQNTRSDKFRFRWPRFSLRALLLLVTVICIWLGLQFESARRQERAVKGIEAAGGTIAYSWEFDRSTGFFLSDAVPAQPQWLRAFLGRHFFDTVIDIEFSNTLIKPVSGPFTTVVPLVAGLPNLRQFHFFRIDLTEQDAAMLAANAGPEKLNCGMMEISDGAAKQIALATRLREIGLNDVRISANAVAEFKKLPHLESFWLVCRQEYDSSSGAPINLDRDRLGDEVTAAFLDFPELRELDLSFTTITDQGVAALCQLKRLKSFGISSPNVTNAAMQEIVKLKELTWLDIGGTSINDDALGRLQELPKLTGLRLSAKITNEGLPTIAKLSQLETLDLGGPGIDDRGLQYLVGMKNLKSLDVQSTKVTTDGAAILQLKKALPKCEIRQYYPSPSFRQL